MDKVIKIGTRDSQLALWQAETVQKQLNDFGYKTELVPVKSKGDLILDKPLYELGITGIFTKTLDVAMLNGDVDIAVHSMKDVPTALPKGIRQSAVLKRANSSDILVYNDIDFLNSKGVIATGSLRRKAQWLNKYPNHEVVDLRGNVNSRLQKLEVNHWNAAIFAKAGLERIHVLPNNHVELDWMIPAPAQGAIVVHTMEFDEFTTKAAAKLNDKISEICTHVERTFLRQLEGGCTAPIGAIAEVNNMDLNFKGVLFSLDGKQKIEVSKSVSIDNYHNFGVQCANEILNSGGKALMTSIKSEF